MALVLIGEVLLHLRMRDGRAFLEGTPRKALRGGMCKSFLRDVVNFWQQMPTKWLQERAKGSKNEHGIPPRRAFCGAYFPPPRWCLLMFGCLPHNAACRGGACRGRAFLSTAVHSSSLRRGQTPQFRTHVMVEMIWWASLAAWECELPLPGSLTSTFLGFKRMKQHGSPAVAGLLRGSLSVP